MEINGTVATPTKNEREALGYDESPDFSYQVDGLLPLRFEHAAVELLQTTLAEFPIHHERDDFNVFSLERLNQFGLLAAMQEQAIDAISADTSDIITQ